MTLYGFCMFILGFGWELWVIDLLLTSMVVCLNWVWALLDVDADCYSIFYISCNKFLYRRSNYMIQNALYGPLCSHLYILVRSNTFLQVLAWHSVFTWNFVKIFCWYQELTTRARKYSIFHWNLVIFTMGIEQFFCCWF